MNRIFMMLSLLAPLIASVPAFSAELISTIVAVVNDDVVTTLDLDNEFKQMAKEGGKQAPFTPDERDQLRKTAINRMVDRKLVDQKIKELDIKVSEEEIRQSIEEVKKQNNFTQERLVEALAGQGLSFEQYKDQIRNQLERLRLMSQEVRAKVNVPLKEVMEYYQANRSRYGEQEIFKARHILIAVPQNADEATNKALLEKALDIQQRAQKGEDFAELARKYSDDPNAAKDGGELGAFKKGDLVPEMEEMVMGLNPGEVSGLVRSKGGIHIVKLEKKYLGDIRPFDEAKQEIEELLYKKKSEERFTQWVEELRKNAAVDIR